MTVNDQGANDGSFDGTGFINLILILLLLLLFPFGSRDLQDLTSAPTTD